MIGVKKKQAICKNKHGNRSDYIWLSISSHLTTKTHRNRTHRTPAQAEPNRTQLLPSSNCKRLANHCWLVVYLPLWKWWSSSVGMMKFPTEWEKNVPNHQPDIMWLFLEYAVRCLSHVLDQWKIQSFHLAMCKKYQRVSTKIMYCNAHIPFGNLTVCCGNHGIFSAMVYNF